MEPVLCPDCKNEMQVEHYYGIAVDVCPACASIWFDESELKALLQIDPLSLLSLEDRAAPDVYYTPEEVINRRCPRCAIPLHAYRYLYDSPVELDGCAQCHGIWVENEELRHLYEILQVQRAMEPDAEEKRRLAIAQYEMESQERRDRANMLASLFSLLRKRVPPFGLG